MASTQWAVNMGAWVNGTMGALIVDVNALDAMEPPVSPADGYYERLELLNDVSNQILLHENAYVKKTGLETSLPALTDQASIDSANAQIFQLAQYISYLETHVLLDFIKYPLIPLV